jgi:hypothetical protein
MLWIRLKSPIIFIGAHSLALVETDLTNICFLYGNMHDMNVCYGCVLRMRATDACYRRSRERLFPHRANPAVSLLSIHSIALFRTATLRRRIFVAHLSRTAIYSIGGNGHIFS